MWVARAGVVSSVLGHQNAPPPPATHRPFRRRPFHEMLVSCWRNGQRGGDGGTSLQLWGPALALYVPPPRARSRHRRMVDGGAGRGWGFWTGHDPGTPAAAACRRRVVRGRGGGRGAPASTGARPKPLSPAPTHRSPHDPPKAASWGRSSGTAAAGAACTCRVGRQVWVGPPRPPPHLDARPALTHRPGRAHWVGGARGAPLPPHHTTRTLIGWPAVSPQEKKKKTAPTCGKCVAEVCGVSSCGGGG